MLNNEVHKTILAYNKRRTKDMFRNEFTLLTDLVREMNSLAKVDKPAPQKFPRYNIKKLKPASDEVALDHELYKVEMALAGYKKEEIEITSEMKQHRNTKYQNIMVKAEKHNLTVDAELTGDYEVEYVEQGITKQSFQSTFIALEKDEIVDSKFVDGILTITIKRSFDREELPVKRIEIQ